MKNTNSIIATFAAFFLFVGLYFSYDWLNNELPAPLCLSNFTPLAVFILIYILILKPFVKKKINRGILTAGIIISLPYMLFLYIMAFYIPITYGIKNTAKYSSILHNDWDKDIVSHFPRTIPSNAENIKFFYRMGFMQGGASIQLRYSVSPKVIDKLYREFAQKKTRSFFGGDMFDHVNNDPANGMPTTYYYTGDIGRQSFQKDFELMIFDWIPSKKEKKRRKLEFSFNHGKSHGVAISKKRNIIVYWAESW